MTRAELIQYITDNVYPNARNEVTAPMVRDSLLEIVDFLGDAATYNIGMVASGNQGLVTGGNVNTAIALALLPYYTAQETGQAIDDAIARIGLGQAAYKNIGQVAENNTDLVTGGQVYTAINTALTSAIKFQGISDTPLTDGSTTNPIQINGQSYTAKKGDMVVYGGNEFLWVGNKWQQMGDESSYALKTVQIVGTGYLTGGGDLTMSRTLDISATAKGYIDHGEAAYNYFPGGVLDSTHLPSMYIGTTSVQFSAVAQNLTGISSVRATSNVLTLFEWDVTNSAWHFHGNIYTDGWFSGGGISPGGGGGGGGIDPVAMWRLLTNDPSLTQYDDYTKISADHINFPVTSVVGLTGAITKQQIAQALELGSLAYKNSLSVSDIPDLSATYLPKSGGAMTGVLSVPTGNLSITNAGSDTNDQWINFYDASGKNAQIGIRRPINNYGPTYHYKEGTTEYYYKFWHEGNFTPSNYLTTATAASTYLPLAGGTLSNANANILTLNRVGQYESHSWLYFGVNGATVGSIAVTTSYQLIFNDTTANREVWHAGNSNGAFPWACSTLTASSTATFNGPVRLNDDAEIKHGVSLYKHTDNTSDFFVGYNESWGAIANLVYSPSYTAICVQYGNFGVGTTTPGRKLDVRGDFDLYGNLYVNPAGTAGQGISLWTNDAPTLYGIAFSDAYSLGSVTGWSTTFSMGNSSGMGWIFRNATNGPVASIGCDGKVYFKSDGPDVLKINRTGSGEAYAWLGMEVNGTQYGRYGIKNDYQPYFHNMTTDYKMWHAGNSNKSDVAWACSTLTASSSVTASGGFTSNAGEFLRVYKPGNGTYNKAVFTITSNHVEFEFPNATDAYGGAHFPVYFGWRGGVYPLTIAANTFIGIKNTNPQYELDVSGVIHATTGIYTDGWFSGGGVASSSDRRLKKNIKNFAYTPKLLLAIRPREWDWKDGSAMVGHAAGFVAQEIEPIMPYAVDGTRNFKALFYDRFHALEIAGLQDHERRIVELERAVKERDKKIAKLEKMLKLN